MTGDPLAEPREARPDGAEDIRAARGGTRQLSLDAALGSGSHRAGTCSNATIAVH